MNELVGFVNANNVRQKVLSLLSSKGEMEGKRICKDSKSCISNYRKDPGRA